MLGPDYLGRPGVPGERDPGKPLVDDRTLAAAHAERAWTLSRAALRLRLPGGHSTWSQIESGLEAADRLPVDADSRPRRDAARGALELARGRPRVAIELVEAALPDFDLVPVDRCVGLLLLAEARRAAGEPENAQQALLAASRIADRLADLDVSARIESTLAQDAALLGRLDDADRSLRRAVGKQPVLAQDPDLKRTRVEISLAIGRPASADRLAVDPTDPLRAEARIALGDPAEAVAIYDAVLAGTNEPDRQVGLLTLRARARAALLDLDRAVDDAMLARERYVELGDTEGAGVSTMLAAEVMLDGVGPSGKPTSTSTRVPELHPRTGAAGLDGVPPAAGRAAAPSGRLDGRGGGRSGSPATGDDQRRPPPHRRQPRCARSARSPRQHLGLSRF